MCAIMYVDSKLNSAVTEGDHPPNQRLFVSGGNGANRNTIFAVHGCGAVIPLKDNWSAHVKGNPVRDSRECAILIDG